MTVFKSMSIYKNPQLHFRDNEYIIGDPAYTLSKHMIMFRSSLLQTSRQKKYNNVICKNRIAVEHVFGKLKSRFKSLDGLSMKISKESNGVQYAWEWVWACLILHNILIDDNWFDNESNFESFNENVCLNEEPILLARNERQDKEEGVRRRNSLIDFVNDIYLS
uniref:DDE Tnp4 domain-containing protein n=1 Tax=Strigamia maritima TaxID=126957 RepID=T1IRF7_STRMM